MKQFGKILNFELKNYIKNKAFVGVTIFLVVIIAVVMFFPRITSLFESGDSVQTPDDLPVLLVKAEDPAQAEMVQQTFGAALIDYDVQVTDEGAIMTYDNNLQQLQQKVALKKQLEAKLNDLRDQRKVFDQKVMELRVAYRSEQEDVEKLEGNSLANYFYRFVGKLDDKLTSMEQAADKQIAALKSQIEALVVSA